MNSTDCKLNPEADWATIRQLRADLATVTAELFAEVRAHAETRKALEKCEQALLDTAASEREARAELAKAEARIQSASLLLDKCECLTLSTRIQLWQLETP